MHDTLATMMTSLRSSSALVAEWRILSISSLIDASFSMYVSVRRDVRLGLVVVVVADEVAHGVVGEERLELVVELRRERLVGRDDQRRLVHRGDDVRHRERLAGAGDAEQHLVRARRRARPSVSAAIACGWSPCGVKSARSRNDALATHRRPIIAAAAPTQPAVRCARVGGVVQGRTTSRLEEDAHAAIRDRPRSGARPVHRHRTRFRRARTT